MSARSRGGRGRWLVWLPLVGCAGEYPLPPTACDEWCHAVQRGGCADDDPAACVRECEDEQRDEDAALAPSCDQARRARADCLLRADAQSFVCEDRRTRVPDTCLDERRAVSECMAPGSGACFDQCVRQAEACRARLTDCEATCSHPDPACREVDIAYQTCLLDYPVECREPFAPDPRAPGDIPCFDQALAVLDCADF